MKQHNYKKGDKIRIVKKANSPAHSFSVGQIVEVKEITPSTGSLFCVCGTRSQYVHPDDVEPVEEPVIFPLDNIEAGYLLEVKNENNGETFYMTVVPTKYGAPDELGCCCPGKEWWPLSCFDKDTLVYKGVRFPATILRVYGPTINMHLLDNTAEERELLWERQEEPKVVEMTVAEISKKLGYEVKIVKEG